MTNVNRYHNGTVPTIVQSLVQARQEATTVAVGATSASKKASHVGKAVLEHKEQVTLLSYFK